MATITATITASIAGKAAERSGIIGRHSPNAIKTHNETLTGTKSAQRCLTPSRQ